MIVSLVWVRVSEAKVEAIIEINVIEIGKQPQNSF